ncbi:F-box only protein 43 isoform X2 [Stegostoma tigrinum]|nr:F-box only protein 43 isoform X2 [Stegostoma tigrinum]XP_048385932.1 F-box only protein 43 isoform X2 [Stegostoma tigrinum]XP_048385933.1 F-box only protein 43 isoform X2 [Stegostoma tigrinum]XP_048385934.1 F-box only protein 43 isoform X2 [Stegostoma tigrinum]
MLRSLKHSCDLATGPEQQVANHTESFTSDGCLSLGQDSNCGEIESTTHSVNYSSGTVEELESLMANLSPVACNENRLYAGRPSCFSVERKWCDQKRTDSTFPPQFETPRRTYKTITLRRRLLESHLTSSGSVELYRTLNQSNEAGVVELSCTRIDCKGSFCSDSSLDSPEDLNSKALATSTLNSVESGTSCRTKRYLFAQQRTSTIDDLKGKNELVPVECITLEQSTISSKLDFSSFSFSEGYDECTSTEPFETPSNHGQSEINEDQQFLTPVNNFVMNLSENLADRAAPRTASDGKLNNSTTEDSGYTSVGFEKSDSFSNHEHSFQELVQNQKRTPRLLDCKNSQKSFERSKRLSTLSERGSQSEADDEDRGAFLLKSDCNLESCTRENELVFEEKACEEPVKPKDLSSTPALQLVQEICMRKRKRLGDATMHNPCQSEEKSLNESMPSLSRLIGRKMGLDKVDILKELFSRNLIHVLATILFHLTIDDLGRTRMVSKIWKKIVKQDQASYLRTKYYLDEIRIQRMNSIPRAADAETRCNHPSRSALRSVQAQAKATFTPTPSPQQDVTPGGCSTVSKSTSKREEFLKVAKTLFNDEALKPCPRCQSPARYNPMKKRGLCSREGCAFDFCTQCFCGFHGSKECGSRSAKRLVNKGGPPGSAQSKRNLKRL